MKKFIAVVLFLAALTCCQAPEECDLAFLNVQVVDVVEGKIIENQDVLTQGNKIIKIIPHGDFQIRATKTVDSEGKFLIPGLWDMHVHIHAHSETFLPLFLAHGITGIRDLGNIPLNDFNSWKAYVNDHEFAPRLGPIAGKIVDGEDWWAKPLVVQTEEEARKVVNDVQRIGGDYVKIYGSLTPDLVRTITEEAKQKNIPFAGHYVWGMDLKELSDLGFKSIEHLEISLSYARNSEELLEKYSSYVTTHTAHDHVQEFFQDLNAAHRNRDPDKMAKLFKKLRENQTWQCTSVLALLWVAGLEFDDNSSRDLGLHYFPDSLADKYLTKGLTKSKEEKAFAQESLEVSMDIVKKLYDHSVPLLAGGHPTPLRALLPGISLYREMILMQEAGIPSAEVLKTATINPALFMERQHELGSIDEGMFADLVLLKSNPLEDISNIQEVMAVVKDGKYYDRTHLDQVLQSVQEDN